MLLRLAILVLVITAAQASEIRDVPLQSPASTVVPLAQCPASALRSIVAGVEVPQGAPEDLGIGAYAVDHAGRWFQVRRAEPLSPGRHRCAFSFENPADVEAVQGGEPWSAAVSVRQAGLFFWSARSSAAVIRIHAAGVVTTFAPFARVVALRDLILDRCDPGTGLWRVGCGDAASARFRLHPASADPFDIGRILVTATAEGPDGPRRLSGFYRQPVQEAGFFELRFRPQTPGRYRITVRVAVAGEDCLDCALPELEVFPGDGVHSPAPNAPERDGDAEALWVNLVVPRAGRPGMAPDPVADPLVRLAAIAAAGGRRIAVWVNGAWAEDQPCRFDPAAAELLDRLLDRALAATVRIDLVLLSPIRRSEDQGFLDLAQYCRARWSDHPALAGWIVRGRRAIASGEDAIELQRWQARMECFWTDAGRDALPYRYEWLRSLSGGRTQALVPPPLAADGDDGLRTVTLSAPLATAVPLARVNEPGRNAPPPAGVQVTVSVPPDAPTDLGIGAFAATRHGRWFQVRHPHQLPPGRHRLNFSFAPGDLLCATDDGPWNILAPTLARNVGVFFWSGTASSCRIGVGDVVVVPAEDSPPPAPDCRLLELDCDAYAPSEGGCVARTGQRWEMRCLPDPLPANPFDPEAFSLTLTVTRPDAVVEAIHGYYDQSQTFADRGDCELARSAGAPRFAIRYRPRLGGRHRLLLQARWADGRRIDQRLGDLVVAGQAWDDYVRVDRQDPRFFSTGQLTGTSTFAWPVGLNLRSVCDERGRRNLATRLTPARGMYAYRDYLARLAASGATAIEVWMSSWNLALEWIEERPDFHGIGRYNLANAERLDQLLDLAWDLGIRVNLVIQNHGMNSNRCDAEWARNPWCEQQGGPLSSPETYFTDPRALASQEALRRYIIARWADHPAVLGWKLWSEINLTSLRGQLGVDWHRQAFRRWHNLDVYGHPTTTHWAGDYRSPDRPIVGLPEMDFTCIDAYHRNQTALIDLMWNGLTGADGLQGFRKPLLVTEYGGSSGAAPPPQLLAEHRSGPWAALVSGYGGSPMLWWFEWVDQNRHWGPYAALSRFMAGEDLRGADARPVALEAQSAAGTLWCRSWLRPGRILGYCADWGWACDGKKEGEHGDATISIGKDVKAGSLRLEWWDADRGERTAVQELAHAGGPLLLRPPPFCGHIAFKVSRSDPTARVQVQGRGDATDAGH